VDVAQSRRSFLINGASLIGAPPFAGFVAKLTLFQTGVSAGAWFPVGLLALCGAFLLVSVVRAWERLPAGKPERGALAPRVLSVLLVILGLLGTFVVDWAQAALQ
jgi:formate hydrogenlyase subunit 3/multisubunit Na+/H+ antiporter MnhD subunit